MNIEDIESRIKSYKELFKMKSFEEWFRANKDVLFRYWVYRRGYTPYEMDKKFMDESLYEDSYADYGYLCEAVGLPDGDIMLGFICPIKGCMHISYYKLSEIRLAYYPTDRDEVDLLNMDEEE